MNSVMEDDLLFLNAIDYKDCTDKDNSVLLQQSSFVNLFVTLRASRFLYLHLYARSHTFSHPHIQMCSLHEYVIGFEELYIECGNF